MRRTSHVGARDPRHQTKQIQIIHLSDVHFGKDHRFDPPPTPGGDRPKRVGYPTLLEKLQEDLPPESFGCPTIVCITGDFCTTAAKSEFDDAEALVAGIAGTTLFGSSVGQYEKRITSKRRCKSLPAPGTCLGLEAPRS
jgi:3',5'-cyclic AMP phosphodiesterase CpdA